MPTAIQVKRDKRSAWDEETLRGPRGMRRFWGMGAKKERTDEGEIAANCILQARFMCCETTTQIARAKVARSLRSTTKRLGKYLSTTAQNSWTAGDRLSVLLKGGGKNDSVETLYFLRFSCDFLFNPEKNSRQDGKASKRQNRKQKSAVATQNAEERICQQLRGNHWSQGRSAIPSVVQAPRKCEQFQQKQRSSSTSPWMHGFHSTTIRRKWWRTSCACSLLVHKNTNYERCNLLEQN
jgi:hypothetical protein